MASQHELEFKASVDMSLANSQIQQAAKNFNIGMVRQAVNTFGGQLQDLAKSVGASELAEAFNSVTDSASDAINAFRAFGTAGAVVSIFMSALNELASAMTKAVDSVSTLSKTVDSIRRDDIRKTGEDNFNAASIKDKVAMATVLQDQLAAKRIRLEKLVDEAQSFGIDFNNSANMGKYKGNKEAEERAKKYNEQLNALTADIARSEATLKQWQSEIRNLVATEQKAEQAVASAQKAEEERRRREEEAARRAREDSSKRTADIFYGEDQRSFFTSLREQIEGGGLGRANALETAKRELQAENKAIADARARADRGEIVDNEALSRSLARRNALEQLLNGAEKSVEDKLVPHIEQTLGAMSDIAAIGGSIEGEGTTYEADQLKELTEIHNLVGYIRNQLMNDRTVGVYQ